MLEGNAPPVNVYNVILMMEVTCTYYEWCENRREVKNCCAI